MLAVVSYGGAGGGLVGGFRRGSDRRDATVADADRIAGGAEHVACCIAKRFESTDDSVEGAVAGHVSAATIHGLTGRRGMLVTVTPPGAWLLSTVIFAAGVRWSRITTPP